MRNPDDTPELEHERREVLVQVERWLEVPMLVLGFVWLMLLGIELLWERTWDENPILSPFSIAIWIVFIIDFVIEVTLAPILRAHRAPRA